jgi:hypothetical protein
MRRLIRIFLQPFAPFVTLVLKVRASGNRNRLPIMPMLGRVKPEIYLNKVGKNSKPGL